MTLAATAIVVAASWGYSADQATTPAAARTAKGVIAPPGPKPVGPYSPGIVAGDFLYVSGQGARDPDGQLPATVDAQVRQAFDNVKAIVEAAGLTLEHVVYSQVYLRDMAAYDQMDRIWREYFAKAPPARAVLGVYRMPTDTPVEISAVAVRDLSRKTLIVAPASPRNISWTPGVMAGDRLYLSGSFGADATGRVADSADAQVQLALDNMRETLAAAGLDCRHLVFVNPYLTDKASAQMNAIYAKQFEFGNAPARATIRVSSLPGGNTIQFTGVAVADLAKRVAVRPKNMRPSPTASPCVWAGDTYFCSAKGPFTPGPDKVQGIFVSTVEAQVRQTMRNLLDGLEEAGLSFSNVVASNVYLDDIDDFSRMNRIYAQYFPEMFPTRTTVAPLPPIDRTPTNGDTWPGLEQISVVAVR
jgi:reactive intermediate/imine deaminase